MKGKVKEESEKVGLKLNIQETKIMASGPITSWQIDGEIVETVSDFIFLGSKITTDGDCSNEIKRHWLLGRKVMTNLLLLLLLSRFSRVRLCATPWRQPTRLCRPWDSPGKNTGVGCHCLLHCVKVKSESEVAQSCPTLSDPMDCNLPGSSIHGSFQARVLEWVAISFSNAWKWKVKVKSLSRLQLFATPWTAAHQAPPSMGFSRQEYWSGVPNTKTFHEWEIISCYFKFIVLKLGLCDISVSLPWLMDPMKADFSGQWHEHIYILDAAQFVLFSVFQCFIWLLSNSFHLCLPWWLRQ